MMKLDNHLCTSWPDFTGWLSKIPALNTDFDYERYEFVSRPWIFRGHQDSTYQLEPTIERAAQGTIDWSVLEKLVAFEFKARARSHMSASLIPTDDPLMWLAEMQHHGIPTRLLDFTFSPFVALHFAIRNAQETQPNIDLTQLAPIEQEQLVTLLEKSRKPKYVRLWAIDAYAVNDRCRQVTSAAAAAEIKAQGQTKPQPASVWSGDPDDSVGQEDMLLSGLQDFTALINKSLSTSHGNKYKGELSRRGCVCTALPSSFNSRLASQQGVFLINLAETRFRTSLEQMMDGCSGWGKTCDIPISLIPEIEEQLLQMNIHEQSLFPDLRGLVGLILQKIRLQKFQLLKIE
jgi:FRG domain